jgi:hypothetical protein
MHRKPNFICRSSLHEFRVEMDRDMRIIRPFIQPHRGKLEGAIPAVIQTWKIFCRDQRKHLGGCIQKFPDWAPGARTANETALCW